MLSHTANQVHLQNYTLFYISLHLYTYPDVLLLFLIYLASVGQTGGYRYGNGAVYVGAWNSTGRRHGYGHLLLPDGTRYDGFFHDGLFHGFGMLTFSDGAK
jgi:hypothetical protein